MLRTRNCRNGFVPVRCIFHKELEPIRVLFAKTNIPLDNRELRKQLNERLQALDDALWIKESLLKAMCVQPFIVAEYLKLKAKVMLSLEDNSSSSSSPSTAKTLRERKERVERTRSSFYKSKSRSSYGYSASGALSHFIGMENGKDA